MCSDSDMNIHELSGDQLLLVEISKINCLGTNGEKVSLRQESVVALKLISSIP